LISKNYKDVIFLDYFLRVLTSGGLEAQTLQVISILLEIAF
jgi:hypothetical protein